MEMVVPRLYASAPEALGFGPDLEIRAFLLQRDQENLLVYRSSRLQDDVAKIQELGGVSRQYLNHHHEISPATRWVSETFGAALHVHELEAGPVSELTAVGETFATRHSLGDFEVIPAPGHTGGATVFRWDTGAHRILFTGDTIFFSRGRWVAAVLDDVSDREEYIRSLKMIRELEFDVIIPGIAPAGEPYVQFVEPGMGEPKIDEIILRLSRGKNG